MANTNRDPSTGRFTSGGAELGTAVGRIVIDASGVASGMAAAQTAIDSSLSRIGDSISRIGSGFTQLGVGLTGLFSPLLVFGKTGLEVAADFDVLLKQIEVFGGVAPDQMETVRQFALQMGADTKYSADEAASALLELLKSGQSLEQAMATLPTVLNLAAAGELGLAEAAGIVSSGLAVFSLEAADSARVSDALARAANASRADVRDLGEALTNVGPVAAQFGLSIEETIAVLGVFAQNGVMGAEAGTQLKSVLLNLTRPTDQVKSALARLGVSLYDSRGNARNFNTVIKELDRALDVLPVEQQNELMQVLGGSYGIVGLSALRASEGIDTMLESMGEAPDAAAVAESFMDTFSGSVEQLTGSVETLQITALTPLMNEHLTPLVQMITDVVNSVTEWIQANPELAGEIIKVLAVIVTVGPVLLGIGLAVSALGTAFTGLGILLSGPLVPIALIVGALIALADHFNITWEQLQVYGNLIVLYAQYYFGQVVTAIQNVVTSIQGFIAANPEFIVALGAIGIAVILPTALVAAFNIVLGLGSVALGVFTTAMGILLSPIVLVAAAIIALLYAVNELYPGGLSGVLRDAALAAQQLAAIFLGYLSIAATWARDRLAELLTTINNIIAKIQEFKTNLETGVGGLGNIIGGLTSGQFTLEQVFGAINAEITAPSRDSGGSGMAGMPYLIGRGAQPELFIPSTNGTFVPNADRLMGGETITFEPGSVVINASTREGGEAAAEAFEARFNQLRRKAG